MKKLVFAFVAFAALSVSMTSCFDGKDNKDTTTPETEVIDDTLNKDSANQETATASENKDAETADKNKDAETAKQADDAEKAPEAADKAEEKK